MPESGQGEMDQGAQKESETETNHQNKVNQMPKNIFHSKLMNASKKGILTLSVRGDVSRSKYPDKPDYVKIELNGEEFYFSPDNEECLEAFRGQAGKTITIQLEGGGKGLEHTSKITRVGHPGSEPPDNDSDASASSHQEQREERQSAQKPSATKATTKADNDKQILRDLCEFLNGNQTLLNYALVKANQSLDYFETQIGTALSADHRVALFPTCINCICFGASGIGLAGRQLPPNVQPQTRKASQ